MIKKASQKEWTFTTTSNFKVAYIIMVCLKSDIYYMSNALLAIFLLINKSIILNKWLRLNLIKNWYLKFVMKLL